MLLAWFRVVRVRFLLASVIAVSVGIAFQWNLNNSVDLISASITFVGVISLHASVDLLNDYWDFKRGIDSQTKRTKMSGGTGVLPDGILKPSSVYRAGIGFLILGGIIGAYFVFIDGFIIAAILAFAIVSIYFYSTKIVDSGLAEFFVAVKGTMIVLGTFYIQSNQILGEVILGGILIGILSSLVLFIASFPDYDADKSKGRKTLVILVGKERGSLVFWIFPTIFSLCLILGNLFEWFPLSTLIAFFPLPLVIFAGVGLKKNYDNSELLFPSMSKTLMFSRLSGVLFVIGVIISI